MQPPAPPAAPALDLGQEVIERAHDAHPRYDRQQEQGKGQRPAHERKEKGRHLPGWMRHRTPSLHHSRWPWGEHPPRRATGAEPHSLSGQSDRLLCVQALASVDASLSKRSPTRVILQGYTAGNSRGKMADGPLSPSPTDRHPRGCMHNACARTPGGEGSAAALCRAQQRSPL